MRSSSHLTPDASLSSMEANFVLPSLPAVVRRLIGMLDSGRTTATDVAEVLSADAGLVAQLLKIVNSVYYGLPTPIYSVKHAVAYLGLAEIRHVALTVGVMEKLQPNGSEEFERFWHHSFHTALAAKLIGGRLAMIADPEELHAAALLHDLGKLAYLKLLPSEFEMLNEHRRKHGAFMADAERHLDLPSHARLGADLCDRWLLPSSIKRACESHELSDLQDLLGDGQAGSAQEVICVANLLSNLCTEELTEDRRLSIKRTTSQALGMDDEGFLLLMGELYELGSEVHEFLREL